MKLGMLLIVLCLSLSACGQAGRLYLPPPHEETPSATSQPNAMDKA